MKRLAIIAGIIVVAVGVIIAISLATKEKPATKTPETTAQNTNDTSSQDTTPSAAATVTITSDGFDPADVTIKKGESVAWFNQDTQDHTVTGTGENAPGSASMGNNTTYLFTFTQAGTYNYSSVLDDGFEGTVTVTE